LARTKKTEQSEKEVSTVTSAPSSPSSPDKLTLSNPAELTVNPSEPTVVKEGKFTIIHH
jgi:hypothetical protein